MVKVRQDAWSHEDDLLLAETVLRHVREGSTQLNAFEEVGDKLNRTSAACGFRWNAEVRTKYIDAMELAKRQRKERKRALTSKGSQRQHNPPEPPSTVFADAQLSTDQSVQPELTMEAVIHFLQEFNRNYYETHQSKEQVKRLKKDNETLNNQVQNLEEKLARTEKQLTTIQEDYQTFIQIMERARKMTVLDDTGSVTAPSFRMDKNGNLEKLIQGLNQ